MTRRTRGFYGLFLTFVAMMAMGNAMAQTGSKKASLDVTGSGARPLSQISLSTGKSQMLMTQSDKEGNFTFAGLGYIPGFPLAFQIKVSQQGAKEKSILDNNLSFTFDPIGGAAKLKGEVTKAASVVINLGGTQPGSAVANDKGYFEIMTLSDKKLAKGDGQLIASIVNVQESCCPRSFIPANPLVIAVSSAPFVQEPKNGAWKKAKPAKPTSSPSIIMPIVPQAPAKKAKVPREKTPETKRPYVPYIIQGSVSYEDTISVSPLISAVSFPAPVYEATWVGGLKELSDQITKDTASRTKMLGPFLDGQNMMNSMRSLQTANVNSKLKYQPSTSVCRFGSSSTSLAASDALAMANKLAFNEVLRDTETQVRNTVFAKTAAEGRSSLLMDFRKKYCRSVDNNNGLKSFCKGLGATDVRFNHDVDYTRVFDAPLTVKTNFTDAVKTPEEEDVIALFRNLSMAQVLPEVSQDVFKVGTKIPVAQDLRAAIAAHGVAQNTFADIVGQKSEGSGAAAGKLKEVIQHSGLTEIDADKHVGSKPSYYAQMEILAKKMYQDPAFVANLYESPENVTRQRMAIKSTSLQQGADLYQSLKRREMLLSALLELKLHEKARQENQSGSAAD